MGEKKECAWKLRLWLMIFFCAALNMVCLDEMEAQKPIIFIFPECGWFCGKGHHTFSHKYGVTLLKAYTHTRSKRPKKEVLYLCSFHAPFMCSLYCYGYTMRKTIISYWFFFTPIPNVHKEKRNHFLDVSFTHLTVIWHT